MIFVGEYDQRVDSRGRVRVPPEFADAFAAGVVIARGFERCVSVFTPEAWERLADEISSLTLTAGDNRLLARFVFASAHVVQVDAQGRLAVPASLREYAGVDHDVTIAGAGASVEIWDRAAWVAEGAGLEAPDGVVQAVDRAA